MNWRSFLLFNWALASFCACVVEDTDSGEDEAPAFRKCVGPYDVNEAIAEIPNSNGKLCDWFSTSRRKCVSKDRVTAIGLNDTISCSDKLYLCDVNSAGTLSGCTTPPSEYGCSQAGHCWCTGVLDCGLMFEECLCDTHCGHDGSFDGLGCVCNQPHAC